MEIKLTSLSAAAKKVEIELFDPVSLDNGGESDIIIPSSIPNSLEELRSRTRNIAATGVVEILLGCAAMYPVYSYIFETIQKLELPTSLYDLILPTMLTLAGYIATSAGIEDIAISQALDTAANLIAERDSPPHTLHEMTVRSTYSDPTIFSIVT